MQDIWGARGGNGVEARCRKSEKLSATVLNSCMRPATNDILNFRQAPEVSGPLTLSTGPQLWIGLGSCRYHLAKLRSGGAHRGFQSGPSHLRL